METAGKRLLITGGGRRIGAAIAGKMAAAGCVIALHCRSSVAEAEELLEKLPGRGHTLHVLDLSLPHAAEKLVSEVGRFDFLVNNAAIFFRPGSPEDERSGKMYELINYTVPMQLLELFACQDIAGGAAVNMLDCTALKAGSGSYWQSKKKLLEATGKLAVEWGSRNLRVNGIAPGAVLPPPWAPDSKMSNILAQTPLHRATTPEEIARAVEFMLTCDSLTGAVLPLDGGLHLS